MIKTNQNISCKADDFFNLGKLEKLVGSPVYRLKVGFVGAGMEDLWKYIELLPGNQVFGVLITFNPQVNSIKKVWSLIYISILNCWLRQKIARLVGPVLGSYGIYPEVQNPFVVYQLGTAAEKYANEYVLPFEKSRFKRFLRDIFIYLVKYHPSAAGIIILSRKN